MREFAINDLVYIDPKTVDPYFQLKKPRGRIVRNLVQGNYKVEIFDTGSQDSEGYNAIGKFKPENLSLIEFPEGETPPKAVIHPLEGPVFTKRPEKEKYQVRFWSTPEDYGAFSRACESEGLVMQDVFNELMIWFTQASLEKRLQIQPAKKESN